MHGHAERQQRSAAERILGDGIGYLFVESLFSPAEVRELSEELRKLASDPRLQGREERITEPGSDAVRSIFRIHKLCRAFDWLARDTRL